MSVLDDPAQDDVHALASSCGITRYAIRVPRVQDPWPLAADKLVCSCLLH
jgi:hypothetical protein